MWPLVETPISQSATEKGPGGFRLNVLSSGFRQEKGGAKVEQRFLNHVRHSGYILQDIVIFQTERTAVDKNPTASSVKKVKIMLI